LYQVHSYLIQEFMHDVPISGTFIPNSGIQMRPLDALLSQPEQRLIGTVLAHPGQEFGTLELLSRMGSSRSAGSAVIQRCVESGLLKERRVGNQRRLAANPD